MCSKNYRSAQLQMFQCLTKQLIFSREGTDHQKQSVAHHIQTYVADCSSIPTSIQSALSPGQEQQQWCHNCSSVLHFTRSRAVYTFKKPLLWICNEKHGSAQVQMLQCSTKRKGVSCKGTHCWKQAADVVHLSYTPDWSSTSTKCENSSLVIPMLSLMLKTRCLVFSLRADNKHFLVWYTQLSLYDV